jgi:hypothetical protein
MSKIFKSFFKSQRSPETDRDGPSEIGTPMDVTHNIHVAVDESGKLAGLPEPWVRLLQLNNIRYQKIRALIESSSSFLAFAAKISFYVTPSIVHTDTIQTRLQRTKIDFTECIYFSVADQKENPDLVYQALKIYSYSMKKKPFVAETGFKPIAFEGGIEEETDEINEVNFADFGESSYLRFSSVG